MTNDDPWLAALRQQDAIVQYSRRDRDQAIREGWKVDQAERALDSVEAAYHRLLADAPRPAVVRHLRERVATVRA